MTNKWRSIKTVKKDGTRVWLALKNGWVALGSWVLNPPTSYKPGHWRTDLGIASTQSELGNPVAWQQAAIPVRLEPPE